MSTDFEQGREAGAREALSGMATIDIDITRRQLRMIGTAYDINRVMQACQNALSHVEQNGMDVHQAVTVVVPAPQENET